MGEILKNDKGPFQVLFGDDASANPNIVFPIVIVIVVALLIWAMRVALNEKGKGEMTEEELEKDRAILDARMEKQAEFAGEEYDPAKARVTEAVEIAEANRRFGRKPDKGN